MTDGTYTWFGKATVPRAGTPADQVCVTCDLVAIQYRTKPNRETGVVTKFLECPRCGAVLRWWSGGKLDGKG